MSATWARVTSFENLCAAAQRAARHKRRVAGAARFLERLEPEALALQRELTQGTWRPGRPTSFTIRDPKVRVITAAPFRDRVVHHALIDPLEQRLDAALVPQSFACRKGKGTHRALAHARDLVRTHTHFLKLDIEQCFDSIEHRVVMDTLGSLRLEPELMALAAHILAGPPCGEAQATRGLAIGNLTSQWFANLVLGRIDRFVLDELGFRSYVRYMDDFVLFADEKRALGEAQRAIAAFVSGALGLRLKERATVLAPVSQGLPFLGWRVYRGTTRLRPANARRTRQRLRRRRGQLRTGQMTCAAYRAALTSVLAHLDHGDTREWRRAALARLFESEHE